MKYELKIDRKDENRRSLFGTVANEADAYLEMILRKKILFGAIEFGFHFCKYMEEETTKY